MLKVYSILFVELAVVYRMPAVVASDRHFFHYLNCPGSFYGHSYISKAKKITLNHVRFFLSRDFFPDAGSCRFLEHYHFEENLSSIQSNSYTCKLAAIRN